MTLSNKILVLLVVPAIFQLVLLATVAGLQNRAEIEAEEALKGARLASAVNALNDEIFIVAAAHNGEASLRENLIDGTDLGMRFNRMQKELKIIRELIGNDKQKLASLDESVRILKNCQNIINRIRKSYREKGYAGARERVPMWHTLMLSISGDMFRELKAAAEAERIKSEAGPGKQREFRNLSLMITLFLGGVTTVSTAALGVYLLRSVTNRLSIMRDNTLRLASSRPLNPPLVGGDEIAELDQTFHQMAESVQLAKRKETALVVNAQDIICSMSADYKLISVNPAIETILEFFIDEVEGKSILQFVSQEQAAKIQDYFTRLRNGEKALPTEIIMPSRRGEHKHTLWSAQWSQEQQSYFCVIHDITERQVAARLKQEITAMVNHDIRSPITTLTVALSVLKSGRHGKLTPEGEKLVDRGERSCERILNLTKDLLDLDKLEAGHLELTVLPTSLNEMFKSAIDTTSGIAENRVIRLHARATTLKVMADQPRVEQVLINLLTNAIKYSPDGGTVNLSARSDKTHAIISVQDYGPGIPEDMLQKVFEPFQQVKNQKRKATEGTGLGLAISKQLVELHNGKIWVDSQVDNGSIFLFSLPLAAELPFEKAATDAADA